MIENKIKLTFDGSMYIAEDTYSGLKGTGATEQEALDHLERLDNELDDYLCGYGETPV